MTSADDAYTLAFDFWRLFSSEEAEVGSAVALANEKVPLLLSNAAWFPQTDFQEVAVWYGEKSIVPALILPAMRNETFDEALQGSGFTLERAFTFREVEDPLETTDFVEQVSWAQGRILGEHLAAYYGQSAYGVQLGAAITAAMQRSPDIVSFAAYGADEVAGALVAFERKGSLSAMMYSSALEARLVQEAVSRALRATIFEPLPEGVTLKSEASLERWSIR